jgi:tRNA 2-thiouridine synthesizing protein A
MAEKFINARSLQCPGPIVQLFKAVKESQIGDEIVIEVTDQGFKKDIRAWCTKTGNTLVSLTEDGGVITGRVRKG